MGTMMKKSRLAGYMWYTSTSLRFVGLWPSGSDGIFNFIYFVVVAISMIVQVFQMIANCWMNYTNFETAAEVIGPMMALITSFGKMCIYRYERTRLGRLVVELDNCLEHGPPDVLEQLEAYGQIGSVACGSLLGVSWLLTVVFLSAPMIAQEGRILPFASWYPFDFENSGILYAIAYGHEAVLTCLGCCTMSTEITFVWSICHCCSRLRVLRTELSELHAPSRSATFESKQRRSSRTIDRKLASLTRLHCEILRDLTEINMAYTYIVMVLFFAALIAICCAGLQITGGSAESNNWTIGLFLVLSMYYAEQLLFYYLPGEIVAQEAFAVSFAAYASGWETLSVNNRKTIGLIIMRSQSPLKLRAGQLRPLRLENYGAFLTTTASYFTSLRAVAEDT